LKKEASEEKTKLESSYNIIRIKLI